MAIDINDKTLISLGSRNNRAQGKVVIPAQKAANKPGLLIFQSVNASGVLGTEAVMWSDNLGRLRYDTTFPADEDVDGTLFSAAGGANVLLSNLTGGSVAINTSLISDTDNTDDLGSNSIQWKDLHLNGVAYIDDVRGDIAEFGDATQTDYIKIANGGVLTIEGLATIDGVGTGDLVDKTATEIITGLWDFTHTNGLKTDDIVESGAGSGVTIDTVLIKDGQVELGDSKNVLFGDSGAADGYINYDETQGELVFFSRTLLSEKTLSELYQGTELNPIVTGNLTVTNGTFDWTDSADETAASWSFGNTGTGSDIDITSIANTGEVFDIVANALTTGTVIKITADAMANGTAILVDCAGGVGSSGFYFRGHDGGSDDITLGEDGEINISGSAGNDMLTVDAGDFVLGNGYFRMTLNSDTITITHDGTDAFIKTDDGKVIIQTDEGTDTPTTLTVKPKGTSAISTLELFDTDSLELSLYTAAARGYIKSAAGSLGLQVDTVQDIDIWESIASGNPSINIYGWNTAGTDRESASLTMDDANDEFLIQAANSPNHEGITVDLQETNQRFRMRQNSDVLSFNLDGTDAFMYWSNGSLKFGSDETDASTVVHLYPNGTSEVSSIILRDTDGDRLSLVTAADRAYIRSAGGVLGINDDGDQDVNFFEAATSGENPSVIVSGYVTAGTAVRSCELTMDDTDDEFLIQTENNANHEGITVSLQETNQKFRIRQNSDNIAINHDGTDVQIATNDGDFKFAPDGGSSSVEISTLGIVNLQGQTITTVLAGGSADLTTWTAAFNAADGSDDETPKYAFKIKVAGTDYFIPAFTTV